MTRCYLCGSANYHIRRGKVRDNEKMVVLECDDCGLVFLADSAISEEFYEHAKMHGEEPLDVEEWLCETHRDDARRIEFLSESLINRDLLDFGCGAAGFLLKARTKARSVMGIELEARLQQHFINKKLEVVPRIGDLPTNRQFDLVTAFHVIEHLQDPAHVLSELAKFCRQEGKIIIEVPSSSDALLSLYQSVPFSEFTYWSCHLYLFNADNLRILARKAGLQLDYVKHIQRYPLSNHLYWLAKGSPGGHQKWSYIDSPELSMAYEASLAAVGKTDTIIAALSL